MKEIEQEVFQFGIWQLAIGNELMLPEISQRCGSCGASIREAAMFCPECGKALTQPSASTKPSGDEETSKPSGADNEAASRALLLETANAATDIFDPADKPSASSSLETPEVTTENQPSAAVEPAKSEAGVPAINPSAATVSKHGTYEKARDSLHRASTATRAATREALADNVKRVERIRHVSTVMFEEASYDPSLRFVLVALGLFVVFLVLLLLSKVMG